MVQSFPEKVLVGQRDPSSVSAEPPSASAEPPSVSAEPPAEPPSVSAEPHLSLEQLEELC